ncbi:MAG: hypothetical protein ACFFEF_15645 [Candidatus Thorarchaeota archaeon]
MAAIKLTLYVKSMKVSTSSADMDSVGHQCANPMRTGAYNRMGSQEIFLNQEQSILLDAAIRASDKMKWELEIVDVLKYGFLKRIKSKDAVPRIEVNGKTLVGSPTSDEIIQFFNPERSTGQGEIPDLEEQYRKVDAF